MEEVVLVTEEVIDQELHLDRRIVLRQRIQDLRIVHGGDLHGDLVVPTVLQDGIILGLFCSFLKKDVFVAKFVGTKGAGILPFITIQEQHLDTTTRGVRSLGSFWHYC